MNAHTQHTEGLKSRIARLTLLSLLLALGLFTLLSARTARATVSAGRACMIDAPSGVVAIGSLIGHVGWAYKSGSGDLWTFGATEGTGAFSIPAHGDTHSWSKSGTWNNLLLTFANVQYRSSDGVKLHDADYYLKYRCINVPNGNDSAAATEVQQQATNGYDGLNNNCLTKAVAILTAYGVTNLPPASDVAPNDYFNNKLTGFEAVQPLVTVALSPSSGLPNSWFNAHGYGWPTGEFVDVYWYNIAGPIAGGNPDNSGQFVFNIQVINYVRPGTYQLLFEAVDGITGQKTDVYEPFTIISPTTVTVQKAWTGDGNNNTKTSFAPGDTIHYLAQVTNSGSSTVTATFTFLATGPQQIYYWSGPGNVAPGTDYFYSPSTVPKTAPAGTYTLTITVTYNGLSSQGKNPFTVS